MPNIANNIIQAQNSIQQSIVKAKRTVNNAVTLLAVSKTRPTKDIQQAYQAGQRDFGENYLQESLIKIEQLQELSIIWHFIGPIQSNKTKAIAEHFSWVHTIERLKVAQKLSQYRPKSLPPLQVCLQVNIDGEISKAGCLKKDALDLAIAVASLPNLQLRGLMAIPRPNSGQKPFIDLANLAKEINDEANLKLDTLSMGMSNDLETAISAGATIVRVGTGIFGRREKK